MTVFIVWACYSDFDGVFKTREAAENYISEIAEIRKIEFPYEIYSISEEEVFE